MHFAKAPVAPKQSPASSSDSSDEEVELDSYFLLNAQLAVAASDEFEIVGSIKNILDADYAYPEYIRRNIPSIPPAGQEGLSISRVGCHTSGLSPLT